MSRRFLDDKLVVTLTPTTRVSLDTIGDLPDAEGGQPLVRPCYGRVREFLCGTRGTSLAASDGEWMVWPKPALPTDGTGVVDPQKAVIEE